MPPDVEAEIDELITHYPQKRSASLMLLHAMQEHFGYISRQAVEWIAAKLELQPINVYELVTFYPMFHQAAGGQVSFQDLPDAELRAGRLLQAARALLHESWAWTRTRTGRRRRKDGKFTVEFVECLASCGTAPVMMCNDDFHEGVTAAESRRNPGGLQMSA